MSSLLTQYEERTLAHVLASMKDMTLEEKYEHVARFAENIEAGMLSMRERIEKTWNMMRAEQDI